MSGPVARRVSASVKAGLLKLIDGAVAAGWEHGRASAYLELKPSRAWRWQRRRDAGCLEDLPAGGQAVHGLLEAEQAAIVALHDDWAEIDRSHR